MRPILLLTAIFISSVTCSISQAEIISFDDCPDTPNCVSSQASDPAKHVEPIRYQGERAEVMRKLLDHLEEEGHYKAVKFERMYLSTIYSSRLFGFVDDVEFIFDTGEPLIHVRSASRVGHWDFGANRKRVEALRAVLSE